MLLFVVVLLKRTIYNKETKREAENERRENERSQNGHKKAITAILHQTRFSVPQNQLICAAQKYLVWQVSNNINTQYIFSLSLRFYFGLL